MPKTIIFDIGGVITNTDFKAIYSGFAQRIGIAPEFVIDYHKQHFEGLILGAITLSKFWEDMKHAGADPGLDLEAIWIEEGLKNRKVNKELLAIIKKLRKQYTVGTLTNLTASRFLLDEKMDLYSHFDYAVLSCKEHLKKPDARIYRLALERASAKPDEAIFVDDRKDFISGAEQAGIKSIIYTYPDNAKLLKALAKFGIAI